MPGSSNNLNTLYLRVILPSAVDYCLNQWDKLTTYLQDGRLEIDNNRVERSIKPFVIGRKAWLLSNTPNGAQASAIIYSIMETAKENGLNPYLYLTYFVIFYLGFYSLSRKMLEVYRNFI